MCLILKDGYFSMGQFVPKLKKRGVDDGSKSYELWLNLNQGKFQVKDMRKSLNMA